MSRGKKTTLVALTIVVLILAIRVLNADCFPGQIQQDTLQANPWKEAIETSHSGQKERISHRQQILISALAILFVFSFLYVLKYGKEST